MQLKALGRLVGILAFVGLAACAPKRDLTPGAVISGPDEFAIVPPKPLEAPESFAALPPPTPGGANLSDPTPKADAIIALGGRGVATGAPDGGIVTYASRFGVDPTIRADLAARDEGFQKARRALPQWPWTKNRYERAYRGLALDPWQEWERLRALGVTVPTAP